MPISTSAYWPDATGPGLTIRLAPTMSSPPTGGYADLVETRPVLLQVLEGDSKLLFVFCAANIARPTRGPNPGTAIDGRLTCEFDQGLLTYDCIHVPCPGDALELAWATIGEG